MHYNVKKKSNIIQTNKFNDKQNIARRNYNIVVVSRKWRIVYMSH